VPHLTTCIFLIFQQSTKIWCKNWSWQALTPFPSSILMRWDLNPLPFDRELSLLTTIPGVKSYGGPKHFFDLYKGQRWYVLIHSKGVLTKERSKINKIWGFASQINSFFHIWPACRMLCIPALDRTDAPNILFRVQNISSIFALSGTISHCWHEWDIFITRPHLSFKDWNMH